VTRQLRPGLLLFLGLFVIYNSNLRPSGSGDVLPGSLLPLSLVLDHTIALDRFAPSFADNVRYTIHYAEGHWYGVYPVAGQILISPMYLPLAAIPGIRLWPPETLMVLAKILGKLVASALAALSAVILLHLLQRLTTTGWAWTLTLVYALGTETWSISSQALWQHTFGQLGIACALLFLDRWDSGRERSTWLWACGIATGFALMARLSNVTLLPAIVVGLLAGKIRLGQFVRFAIPPLLGGVLCAAYNLHVFRTVTGYYDKEIDKSLAGTWVEGAVGMLASPGRGLFIYSPVLLFAILAFFPAAQANRAKHRALMLASCVFIVLHSVVIANYPYWWAGHCWGPRYMTEIAAPLIVLIGVGTPVALASLTAKRAFLVLVVYSVLIQAVGACFYPHGLWDATPVIVENARLDVYGIGRTIRSCEPSRPVW